MRFVARVRQTTVGWSEPATFLVISVPHVFEPFTVEASIIMRRHEVPYRLCSDPKILDFK